MQYYHKANQHRRSQGGQPFTMVELMVVIVIMALLMGLVVGLIGKAQNEAYKSKTIALMSLITMALENYTEEYGDYPSCDVEDPSFACGVTRSTSSSTHSADSTGTATPRNVAEGLCWGGLPYTLPYGGTSYLAYKEALTKAQTIDNTAKVLYDKLYNSFNGKYPAEFIEGDKLLDGWGTPFIYLYFPQGTTKPTALRLRKGFEKSYALWSAGPDAEYDGAAGASQSAAASAGAAWNHTISQNMASALFVPATGGETDKDADNISSRPMPAD